MSNARGADKIPERRCANRECGKVFKPATFSGKFCCPACRREEKAIQMRERDPKIGKRRMGRPPKTAANLDAKLEAYWQRVRCEVPRGTSSPIVELGGWV